MNNLTLIINTAVNQQFAALLSFEQLSVNSEYKIVSQKIWEEAGQESKLTLPAIHKLFKDSKCDLANLQNIIAVKGPGSFVAVRVGVIIADALAKNLAHVKLYALNSFEFINVANSKNPTKYPVHLPAGGKDTFTQDNPESPIEITNSPDHTPYFLNASEYLNHLNLSELLNPKYLVEKEALVPYYIKEPSITLN
jgi:tRNA A37 threonylcarbamoyladenosine modification protein TsaB